MMMTNHSLPTYDIHPVSVKMIRQGHPWIIKDKFTEKFHPRDRFIVAKDRKRPFALLIHDPQHKNIKARLWASTGNFQKLIKSFKNDLKNRLQKAIKKRSEKNYLKERNNFYLVFGEADQIPGIHVQFLNGQILIQYYCFFWDNYSDFIIKNVLELTNSYFDMDITKSQVWIQHRAHVDKAQQVAKSLDPNITYRIHEVEEYGVKYQIELGKHYDHGLYTDMAAVRALMTEEFQNAKSILNLFAYTGAFSLFALKNDAEKVVSVDLSENYIEWLEKNINLNEDLDGSKHQSMTTSVQEGLTSLLEEKAKFDLIISDPPSSSSDGNKKTNALKDYEITLPQMAELLAEEGKLILFLNTHKVSRKKFELKILDIIKDSNLDLKIQKTFGLGADCPQLKGFPEGSYLKGIVLGHDRG